jgi:hypothetical protein
MSEISLFAAAIASFLLTNSSPTQNGNPARQMNAAHASGFRQTFLVVIFIEPEHGEVRVPRPASCDLFIISSLGHTPLMFSVRF